MGLSSDAVEKKTLELIWAIYSIRDS